MTEQQLAEVIARHVVSILICTTFAMLAISFVLWRILEKHMPRAWTSGAQALATLSNSAAANRIRQLPRVGRLLTETLGTLRFLGIYALVAFVAALGAGAAFVEVADEIELDESLGKFDFALSSALRTHVSYDTLRLFASITSLGSTLFLTGLVLAVTVILFVAAPLASRSRMATGDR